MSKNFACCQTNGAINESKAVCPALIVFAGYGLSPGERSKVCDNLKLYDSMRV